MEIKVSDDGQIELGDFNALQAYKIARKLEHDGMMFYDKVRKHCANEDIKSAINYLIESEKEHLDYFEKKLEEEQKKGDAYETDDIVDYMDAGIFTLPDLDKACSTDFTSPDRVLTFGFKIEERSMRFYRALREHTHDQEAKKALEDIIREEQSHLDTLQQFV